MGCMYIIDCQRQHRKQEIDGKSAYEIGICTTLPFVQWKFTIHALNIIVEWILVKRRYVQKNGPAKLTQWPTMVGVLIRLVQLTRLFTRPVCFEFANKIQRALFGNPCKNFFSNWISKLGPVGNSFSSENLWGSEIYRNNSFRFIPASNWPNNYSGLSKSIVSSLGLFGGTCERGQQEAFRN